MFIVGGDSALVRVGSDGMDIDAGNRRAVALDGDTTPVGDRCPPAIACSRTGDCCSSVAAGGGDGCSMTGAKIASIATACTSTDTDGTRAGEATVAASDC